MSITEVFPQPKLVRLGIRQWVVAELRIRDLARLQECVEALVPHPYAAGRDRLATLEGRARRRAILKLQVTAAEWPPTYPDELSTALFTATTRGGLLFLQATLGRDNDLDPAGALALYGAMTPDDWDRLHRALWGVTDAEDFDRLLSDGPAGGGTKPDWPKMVAGLQERTGLTLDQIGDLRVSQFHALRTGKGRERYRGEDWSHLSDAEVAARLAEQRDLLAEGEEGGDDDGGD